MPRVLTPEQVAAHQARFGRSREVVDTDPYANNAIINPTPAIEAGFRNITPPRTAGQALAEANHARWKEREAKTIVCADCGISVVRSGPGQRYCSPCSEVRDTACKTKWAREHPKQTTPRMKEMRDAANAEARARGAQYQASLPSTFGISEAPDLAWLVRVAVPFSYAASKNSIYSLRAGGHVFLRKQGRAMRNGITAALKRALRDQPIVQNKVWIDIYVEKPDQRGDAINVVDMVADAVKDACGIDDRWFSIRRLDWRIKRDGLLYVALGQERVEAGQACSYCGRILPFAMFNKASSLKNGHGRVCIDCRRKPKLINESEAA